MRIRVIAVSILALALCAPVLAKSSSARLRIARTSPVTAKGQGFKALEFVRVTLVFGKHMRISHARATANGAFSVVWRGVTLDSCDWRVSAIGGQGSRASVRGNKAGCATLPPFDF